VVALPNAIPLPATNPVEVCSGPLHLIQIGSLTVRKRPALTLESFLRVQSQLPGATLRFVGDGPERSSLEQKAKARGGAGVIFTGALPAIGGELAQANVAILPSVCEGLPYSLLEAAGRGLPLIGTAVDGIPEICRHQKTGLLVQPDDGDGLAAAILRLGSDRELRQRLGLQARQVVAAEFALEGWLDGLERLYGRF
jgi:glycosyltransferase involved in cell wall biosynthesis